MTFYYKNNNIKSLVSYSKDSNVNTYYKVNFQSYSGCPYNNINEAPNNLNYKLNGTDISTYLVSYYLESSGSIAIPSWCNSIRAIIVGGGGGAGDYDHTHNHNSGYNLNLGATTKFYHQTDYDNAGGPGGGGGFVYIANANVSGIQTIQSSIGSGGAAGTGNGAGVAGQNSELALKIDNTIYKYIANAGTGGATANEQTNTGNPGTGGGTVITAIPNSQYYYQSGNSGSAVADSTTSTGGTSGATQTYAPSGTISYGNGGSANSANSNSQAGNNGYIRVYFLTT